MKGTVECKLAEAERVISAFFAGNLELIEKFVEVAAHMMDLDHDVVVRYNSSIIGVAKPGQRYRFYVSNKEKDFYIKYKNEHSSRDFQVTTAKELLICNESCNRFFQDNPEQVVVQIDALTTCTDDNRLKVPHKSSESGTIDKAAVKAQWKVVLLHAEKAIDSVQQHANKDWLDSVYCKVVDILLLVAVNTLDARESKIVISRYLSDSKTTLRSLGSQLDLSAERVRQLAEKKWNKICYGIQRSGDEIFSFYRQQLCIILTEIDVSLFIQSVAYINYRNPNVGELIIKVTTPTYRSDSYERSIAKYQFGNTKRISISGRIPQAIIDTVRNIDIVKHIGSRQPLKQKGEVYQGSCPCCKARALTVYSNNNSYYCFSCKNGGDIIAYERAEGQMDYKTAVLSLAETYNIKMEEKIIPRDVVMKNAAHFYHEQLKSNPKNKNAIDTLHSWGLFGKTIVKLGLGFNDDSFTSMCDYMAKEKQVPRDLLIRFYLAGKTDKGAYYDRMRNSIIIPTVSIGGKVECFDYYNLNKNEFAYYLSSDDFIRKEHLYSLNIAIESKKKSVVVVSNYEAYFALMSKGITNVVSIYMSQISQSQLELLKRYFKVIIFMADGFANVAECRKFCQRNNMYCDNISLGQDSSIEYINSNEEVINEKIAYYESVFCQ